MIMLLIPSFIWVISLLLFYGIANRFLIFSPTLFTDPSASLKFGTSPLVATELKMSIKFDAQNLEQARWANLDIGAHLKASILANVIQPEIYWFSPYLSVGNELDHSNTARLSVHLQAVFRNEKIKNLPVDFISKLMKNDVKFKKATHIVTEINYGYSFVVVFEKPVSSAAEKMQVEEELFLQAKLVFNQLLTDDNSTDSSSMIDASLFKSVTMKVYNNLGLSVGSLGDLLVVVQQARRSPERHCVPVTMTLLSLANQSKIVVRDLTADMLNSLSLLKSSLSQVQARWDQLMQDPFIKSVPLFSDWLQNGFQLLLERLLPKIALAVRQNVVSYRQRLVDVDCAQGFVTEMADGKLLEYVIARKRDLAILKQLLQGVHLDIRTLSELQVQHGSKHVEIFHLKAKKVPDVMLINLKKTFDLEEELKSWTFFEIMSSGQQELQTRRNQLLDFQNAHKDGMCFLGTSETYNDGMAMSWNRPSHQNGSPNSFEANTPTSVPPASRIFIPVADGKEELIQSKAHLDELAQGNLKTLSSKLYSGIHLVFDSFAEAEAMEEERLFEVGDSKTYDQIYEKPSHRPAEEFARHSDLVVNGSPSIYELKARQRATLNEELCWFDIGKPSGADAAKPHKVLILMGATGSGKSTLVNGMVNYILGVEWTDPFRFRIAKEGTLTSQASSQTKGVTAYTIHHVQGMKIDYGVTIIDTPGYGDTGGVERDREITRIIGRFLTHKQTQSEINGIHAVCFVASSADSRLTPTQQHVIESVVSLFGRDVMTSLRLLVTFADGMKPPVLEAIKAAKIAGLSDSKDGCIEFNKFNNSALYASNCQVDGANDDGDLFDKGYWNLGKSNFEEFFSMLAKMPAQSLQQTSTVIKARSDLERSLEAIDEQLKIALEKIEDIKDFNRQIAQLGTKVEASKDYEVTYFDRIREQVPCTTLKMAFNCSKCQTTCGEHWISWLQNKCGLVQCWNYQCPCRDVDHQLEYFRWVERRVQMKRTIQELKEEHERSLGRKSSIQEMLRSREEELEAATQKGVALLRKMAECLKSLESSALSSKTSSVADHVSIMKMRNREEKQSGWAARNKVLDELLAMSLERSRANSVKYGAGGNGRRN